MGGSSKVRAIVIGGSAGALEPLVSILTPLPPTFSLPIALVLHLPPHRTSHLGAVLAARTRLPVKDAEDKEPVAGGTVYLAPPNYHLLIERDHCFALSMDELVNFSRPSIDVLFESAADAYGPALLGVLLSGANEDGARGLAHIEAAGGVAWVQEPESADVRTMPDAGLRLARGAQAFTPERLAALLSGLGPDAALDAGPDGVTRS